MKSNLVTNDGTIGKVAVLVLGMHRSGTSLLGGILEQLGCKGAKSKMAANQWNARGYFESPEVMKLNDAVLDALGSRWDDWSPLHLGWEKSPRFNEFRARIVEVIAAEYGEASLIYIKDPRICRLLPLWREALEEAGYAPVCIHTHRNPADATRSLQVRTSAQVDPGIGMLLWMRHVLDAEAGSRGLPRIFTSYARVLSNWTEFSDQAEQAFDFAWPVIRQAREARVQEIVDPALRHHDTPVAMFLANSAAPDLAKDCLRVLEGWTEKGEDEAGREALALIRERFDHSGALFARPLAELSTYRRRASTLEAERAAAQEAAGKHEAEAASLRNDIEALQQETKRIQESLKAEVQELTQLLTEQQTNLEKIAKERDDLQQQESALEDELRQTRDRLTQQRAEADIRVTELQGNLDATSASLKQIQVRFEALKREQDILLEQESFLRKDLDQANSDVAKVRAEAEAQQAKLQDELNGFADKLIERDQTAAALRKDLDEANSDAAKVRAEAEAQQARLQDELNGFADKLIERDQTAAALRKDLDQANSRLVQVRAEAESQQIKLQAELKASNNRVTDREQIIAALRKELAVQAQAATAQQDNVASTYTNEIKKLHRAYQSSASWKFSAPIRILGRLVR